MSSKVTIKLVKSLIGRKENQIKTAKSLGLTKVGDVTTQEESAPLNGKLKVISHLVTVEKPD